MKRKTILLSKLLLICFTIGVLALNSCTTQKKKAEQERIEAARKKAEEEAKRKADEEKTRIQEAEAAKKAAQEKRKQQVAAAKERLLKIKNDNTISVEDKLKTLADIKNMNLGGEEINATIRSLETILVQKKEAVVKVDKSLNTLLTEIAQAPNVRVANKLIDQTLQKFTSDDTHVLIVVSKFADNDKDYDEPTTIKKYLNYIKDSKQYDKKIETVEYDDEGKIKLLELIKR